MNDAPGMRRQLTQLRGYRRVMDDHKCKLCQVHDRDGIYTVCEDCRNHLLNPPCVFCGDPSDPKIGTISFPQPGTRFYKTGLACSACFNGGSSKVKRRPKDHNSAGDLLARSLAAEASLEPTDLQKFQIQMEANAARNELLEMKKDLEDH